MSGKLHTFTLILCLLFAHGAIAASCPAELAGRLGLNWTSTNDLPFVRTRVKVENGADKDKFAYIFSHDGTVITDTEKIEALPGRNFRKDLDLVWLTADSNAHLSATGIDLNGHPQYLYHPAFVQARKDEKFVRMLEFGKALPAMRMAIARDLAKQPDLSYENTVALAVRILDRTAIRIGGESKTARGLTTLLKTDVTVAGDAVKLDFTGKHGQSNFREFEDAEVAAALRALKRLPGKTLFLYELGSEITQLTDANVNSYIKEISGGDFSAKDFRTWTAAVTAVENLVAVERPATKRAMRSLLAQAADAVSDRLSNTRGVARKDYIDPRIFRIYEESPATFNAAIAHAAAAVKKDNGLSFAEAVVLALLK